MPIISVEQESTDPKEKPTWAVLVDTPDESGDYTTLKGTPIHIELRETSVEVICEELSSEPLVSDLTLASKRTIGRVTLESGIKYDLRFHNAVPEMIHMGHGQSFRRRKPQKWRQ